MRRPVLALGVAAATWAVAAAAQPAPDHLECHKVRAAEARASYTADLGGLVAQPGCTIRTPPVMACVPASKTNVVPAPPGGGATGTPNGFFCYKTKCPRAALPAITGADQFGTHTVTPSPAKLLCAPFVPATTTTTTTTRPLNLCTTTTIMLCGPGPAPHTCSALGACPPGQTCQSDASGCSCVGPPPACSAAGAFFCGVGTCPPGEACQTVCGGDGNLSCQCQ